MPNYTVQQAKKTPGVRCTGSWVWLGPRTSINVTKKLALSEIEPRYSSQYLSLYIDQKQKNL